MRKTSSRLSDDMAAAEVTRRPVLDPRAQELPESGGRGAGGSAAQAGANLLGFRRRPGPLASEAEAGEREERSERRCGRGRGLVVGGEREKL